MEFIWPIATIIIGFAAVFLIFTKAPKEKRPLMIGLLIGVVLLIVAFEIYLSLEQGTGDREQDDDFPWIVWWLIIMIPVITMQKKQPESLARKKLIVVLLGLLAAGVLVAFLLL